MPKHHQSPNVDYTQVGRVDKWVSTGIYGFTNLLRLAGYYSVTGIKLTTDFTVDQIVRAKEFNQRILPAKLVNTRVAPIVHNSVVKLRNIAILLNKLFDGTIRLVVMVGKEVGKIIGITVIVGFKAARYVATNRYSLRDFLPATQDSVEYFFRCTVSEGFEIIEAIDYALTSVFGASTDYVLQTIEHCFGENMKDISKELSVMSRETFEFYKKVKLFKIRSLKTKIVKAGMKEVSKTILDEIKKDDTTPAETKKHD